MKQRGKNGTRKKGKLSNASSFIKNSNVGTIAYLKKDLSIVIQ
jgi:hypothetical protein